MIRRPIIRVALRFARYLHPSGSGCWVWNGAKNEHGYGVLGRGRRGAGNVKAHRVAFELFHGVALDPSIKVLHRYDNPACVNPLHLIAGTQLDNIADMHGKRRAVPPPRLVGVKNPSAKLDEQKVIEIFRLHHTGLASRKLARHFGVSRYAICCVLKRKTWRHVDVTHHLG